MQIGGQSYSQVIFFKHEAALRDFQRSTFELGAQVSVVALQKGASLNYNYSQGVAIFTLAQGGLMAESVVGAQRFTYRPFP